MEGVAGAVRGRSQGEWAHLGEAEGVVQGVVSEEGGVGPVGGGPQGMLGGVGPGVGQDDAVLTARVGEAGRGAGAQAAVAGISRGADIAVAPDGGNARAGAGAEELEVHAEG